MQMLQAKTKFQLIRHDYNYQLLLLFPILPVIHLCPEKYRVKVRLCKKRTVKTYTIDAAETQHFCMHTKAAQRYAV